MFHNFFSSLARWKYLSLFSFPLIFTQWSTRTAKSPILQVLFILIIITMLVFLPGLGDLFITQNHREFCVLFSRRDSGLYIFHLVVWSNLNFLHSFQWINFPTQSCLVLFLFMYFSLLTVFHTSVSRWFLTGIWVTTSLLKSPALFSVLCLISTIL